MLQDHIREFAMQPGHTGGSIAHSVLGDSVGELTRDRNLDITMTSLTHISALPFLAPMSCRADTVTRVGRLCQCHCFHYCESRLLSFERVLQYE